MNTLKKIGTFLYGSICGTLFGAVLGMTGLALIYAYAKRETNKETKENSKYRTKYRTPYERYEYNGEKF